MKCFCDRSTLSCIDMVKPDSSPEMGLYSKETIEQLATKYPGVEIMDFDEFAAFKERALSSQPKEITEERYMEMLCVLPPEDHVVGIGDESFKCCERLSGRITSIYCRLGSRFFTFDDVYTLTHEEIVRRCSAV